MGVYDYFFGEEEVLAVLKSQDWCLIATTQLDLQNQLQTSTSVPIQLIESGQKQISGKAIRTKTLLLQTIEKNYQREAAEEEAVYDEMDVEDEIQDEDENDDEDEIQDETREVNTVETVEQTGGSVDESIAQIKQILSNEAVVELHDAQSFTVGNILDALHKNQTVLHIPPGSKQSYLDYLLKYLPMTPNIEFFFVDKRKESKAEQDKTEEDRQFSANPFMSQYNFIMDPEQPMILRGGNYALFKLFACLTTVEDLGTIFKTGYQFLANIRMGEILDLPPSKKQAGGSEYDDLEDITDPLELLYSPSANVSSVVPTTASVTTEPTVTPVVPVTPTPSVQQGGHRKRTRKYRKGVMSTSW